MRTSSTHLCKCRKGALENTLLSSGVWCPVDSTMQDTEKSIQPYSQSSCVALKTESGRKATPTPASSMERFRSGPPGGFPDTSKAAAFCAARPGYARFVTEGRPAWSEWISWYIIYTSFIHHLYIIYTSFIASVATTKKHTENSEENQNPHQPVSPAAW